MTSYFLDLGLIFTLGLFAHWVGTITALPRVTLLILCGLLIGPNGIDLLGEFRQQWFDTFATIALVMVGFLIGGTLTRNELQAQGKQIITLSLGIVICTFVVVLGGLVLLGLPTDLALLLAAIATATDPAAIQDVIRQSKNSKKSGQLLFGIVALDDAWGLLLFSFCLTIATGFTLDNGASTLLHGLMEVFGSILLGICLGLPMAFLTGRIHEGEPTLIEALGLVFLAAGLALWLELSYLLTAMAMGCTVANLAKHHTRPFHAIEDIEAPFLILFFILAGASFELNALLNAGFIGIAFIVLRLVGKIGGGWLTGKLSGLPAKTSFWTGFALLPQAGVAVGIALVSGQIFPEYAETLLTVTIAATVVFEIIGPIATRKALQHLD